MGDKDLNKDRPKKYTVKWYEDFRKEWEEHKKQILKNKRHQLRFDLSDLDDKDE